MPSCKGPAEHGFRPLVKSMQPVLDCLKDPQGIDTTPEVYEVVERAGMKATDRSGVQSSELCSLAICACSTPSLDVGIGDQRSAYTFRSEY